MGETPTVDASPSDALAAPTATEDISEVAASQPDTIRWKNFKLIVKDVSDDGTFEGYASVWGVVDSDSEVCDKGCTTRSLKNNPNFVLLWMHDTKQPIGFALEAIEDDRGLRIKGQLSLECEAGRYAYAMLKLAAKVGGTARMGLSIGFRALSKKFVEDPKTKKNHLHFTEIALLETSIVTFPANPDAWVSSVKSQFLQTQNEEEDIMRLSDEQIPALAQAVADVITKGKATQVPDKAPSEFSFNAALQHAQSQTQIHKDRNDIEGALYDTLSKIHGSDLPHSDFTKAVAGCFDEYGKAMTDVHARIRQMTKTNKSADISEFVTKAVTVVAPVVEEEVTDLETKKGKAISAANKKKLLAAHAAMQDALASQAEVHKSMFGDSGEDDGAANAAASDQMGSMSDETPIEGKEATEEKSVTTEEKSAAPTDVTAQPTESSDSGIHSLLDDLAQITKSRLESLNGRN